jgi:hypothetical protein
MNDLNGVVAYANAAIGIAFREHSAIEKLYEMIEFWSTHCSSSFTANIEKRSTVNLKGGVGVEPTHTHSVIFFLAIFGKLT